MTRPTADQTRDAHGFAITDGFPETDAATMLELDFLMEGLGIGLAAMKENAARAVAALATRRYFGGCVKGHRITVLAGRGGNGEVALTAGRRLSDWGADVTTVLSHPADAMSAGMTAGLAILGSLGRRVSEAPPENSELIIDGLIGYSLRGSPHGRVAALIGWANGSDAPTLAVDVPSGFDAQSGVALAPAIRADATVALGLPKLRLGAESQSHVVGDLYLGDISIPPEAWERLTAPITAPFFGAEQVLRLRRAGEVI
jgi:NAD(P)H-hydrate epimerase